MFCNYCGAKVKTGNTPKSKVVLPNNKNKNIFLFIGCGCLGLFLIGVFFVVVLLFINCDGGKDEYIEPIDVDEYVEYEEVSLDDDDYTSNKKNEPEVIIVEHQVNTQPVEEWVPCNVCRGSGMCPTCNGTGWLYNDYCPVCLGRKVCQMCWGRRGGYFKVER